VLVGGMAIGTLFTLFVVPAVYVLIARDHRREQGKEQPEQPKQLDPEPASV
jgi:multidrug efflux pump